MAYGLPSTMTFLAAAYQVPFPPLGGIVRRDCPLLVVRATFSPVGTMEPIMTRSHRYKAIPPFRAGRGFRPERLAQLGGGHAR